MIFSTWQLFFLIVFAEILVWDIIKTIFRTIQHCASASIYKKYISKTEGAHIGDVIKSFNEFIKKGGNRRWTQLS